MITSAKLNKTGGFANKLPCLQGRTFNFEPSKINVLFGPNGCGKSTLLKFLGAHCFIPDREAGWTRSPDPTQMCPWNIFSKGPRRDISTLTLKEIQQGLTYKSEQKGTVDWCGTSSFFYNATAPSDNSVFVYDPNDSADGLTDFNFQMSDLQFSHGQRQLARLNQLFSTTLRKPLEIVCPSHYNSTWQATYDKTNELIDSLEHTGVVTVLMDEPDKGFSLPNQFQFWNDLLPAVAKQYQIIVSTHSVFPILLSRSDYNIIDMEVGYVDECKKVLGQIG